MRASFSREDRVVDHGGVGELGGDATGGRGQKRRAGGLDAAADELVRVAERVRRPDDVGELEQRLALGQRLRVEDVEPRAGDASLAQRLDERVLVDDRAARNVDEEGGRLHQPQPARVEQTARLVRQRAGDDDDVGVREQRLRT